MFNKIYISRLNDKTLVEPILVSGKYIGIKSLTVYDFIVCAKIYNELVKADVFVGFAEKFYYAICEQACVVSLCSYDSEGKKLFSGAMQVLENLTPRELQTIYNEYVKLQKKIDRRDKISREILEKSRYIFRKESLNL